MDFNRANQYAHEISDYLTEKEADFDEVYATTINGFYCLEVVVTWGDWKHSHGYLDYLMKEKHIMKVRENVTEEDGSDCYSAIHTYLIPCLDNVIIARQRK